MLVVKKIRGLEIFCEFEIIRKSEIPLLLSENFKTFCVCLWI